MKKVISWLLAALLLITTVSGCAEVTAADYCTAAEALLFETENVTLSALAEFELDGHVFKNVNGTYVQDGFNSMLDVHLVSARDDGREVDSGYAVVVQDSDGWVAHHYAETPFVNISVYPDNTIMKRTIMLDHILELVPLVTGQLGDVMTVEEDPGAGNMLKFALTEDKAPALLDTALTLAYDYGIRRFFRVDYDAIGATGRDAGLDDFITVTDGLVYCTRRLHVKEMTAGIRMDSDGHITGFDGKITVSVELTNGEKHDLTVTAEGAARDYGASHVDLVEYGIGVQTEGDCPCD